MGELNPKNSEVTGLARDLCGCPAPPAGGFTFDCTGKVDGFYPHPFDCTRFVGCVAGIEAWEMPCALMNDNGDSLHYVADSGPDPKTAYCDYPEKAGCHCACSGA